LGRLQVVRSGSAAGLVVQPEERHDERASYDDGDDSPAECGRQVREILNADHYDAADGNRRQQRVP
jgi:hypothetical protein